MQDAYADDLSDFIRNGKLDCYELTDEELARFLEVWRWSIWTRLSDPSGPDHDVLDVAHHLEMHMARHHGVEVDYNTLLLLRQEIEPLMYLRVLYNLPHALLYFLDPRNLLHLFRSLRRIGRYKRIKSVSDDHGERGYPVRTMDEIKDRAPDLLRRVYWRRIGQNSVEMWRRQDTWW
jgi:hypothetical protein